MHKTHIWIIAFLSVLSITLAIMLSIMAIKYKNDTGDIPVEEFYKRDYSDTSYHINDYRNYGFGQCSYDKEFGLLLRERKEGDFYFEYDVDYEDGKKVVFRLHLFNYGENYKIFYNIYDDVNVPVTIISNIKEFRYHIIDRHQILIKKTLYNKKYGDACLTDLVFRPYNSVTGRYEDEVHKDVFVTPLALKHIQDRLSVRCLAFFQFVEAGPNEYSPDVVKEVVAVGDYDNTYIFKDYSDMICTK